MLIFLIAVCVVCNSLLVNANVTDNKAIAQDTNKYLSVKVLGINDFHGQVHDMEDKGGMTNLSGALLHAIDKSDAPVFVLHGGDHVGASPAESALLQDEPAIDFLNIIGNYCKRYHEHVCAVMGTAGNHEFDEGSAELQRLLRGGNHEDGPFIHNPWPGANYDTLSANVIDKMSGELLLTPYRVHRVEGIDIGFIGITLDYTPKLVTPGMVDDLVFQSQLASTEKYVQKMQEKGIESIVLIIHDGSSSEPYKGRTQADQFIPPDSRFGRFVAALPNAVDLVVSGHSHSFTNVMLERKDAPPLLVTQAYSAGRAYADINLMIDRETRDVVSSSAEIISVESGQNMQLSEAADTYLTSIKKLVKDATAFAQSYTSKVLNRYQAKSGEISLGSFIATTHHYAMKSDLGVMNPGGVRADLEEGEVTLGDVFSVQPFGNYLMVRAYTGKQLLALFETDQHWSQNVVFDENGKVKVSGEPIKLTRIYKVAGNNYLMSTADFKVGKEVAQGLQDVDATAAYIQSLPTPFNLSSQPSK